MNEPIFLVVKKISGQECRININNIDFIEPVSTSPHIKCTILVGGRKLDLETPYRDVVNGLDTLSVSLVVDASAADEK